jgi:hypothetical protein
MTIRESNSVNTLNGNGSTVEINLPTDKPRAKPTTLSVAPGRTAVLDKPIQPEVRPPSDAAPPVLRATGLNWVALLQNFGPPFGVALYLWRAGRKRLVGSLEQVNLGVYKGAMPLEMITAQHKKYIFTRREAMAHLFGKAAADFSAARPAIVGRAGAAPAGALLRVR